MKADRSININTNLDERNQLTDDQPNVKHLEVGGGGQDLPHVDDDRRHHQHRRQVHPQSSLKEGRFEEHGSISWKKGKEQKCGEKKFS